MIDETAPPALMLQLATGFWLTRAVWLAAHFRIADAIGAETLDVSEIARRTGTHTESLRRLLNALAASGFFRRGKDDRFSLNAASELLLSDTPGSQRAFVDSVLGGEHYEAWGSIAETLRSGRTAFDVRYGEPVFEYLAEHPVSAALFGEAMTATTQLIESAVVDSHRFPDFRLAVDVGGSHGSLVRRLLTAHPHARGIVFDRPETIEVGQRTWAGSAIGERLEAVAGDFFAAVPDGGDLYLLKFILHDWSDEQSATILRNIRQAIRPDGHLAIIENVLPDNGSAHPGWMMDLNMLAITGGRERTAAEFRALLIDTGFEMMGITATGSPISVIEARPTQV